jgi:hypothetical protein
MAKVVKGLSLRQEIYDKVMEKARAENRNFSNTVECILEEYLNKTEPPVVKLRLGGSKK